MVNKMKRIYITGIAGLLGSNVAYELSEKYIIYGGDLTAVNIPGVETQVYDMLDYEKLHNNILNTKPDVVIHTAAAVNVDGCEEQPEFAEKLNADLTREIAELCLKNHINMIYISTDAVFDGTATGLYDETDAANPINVYGKTKLMGETYVLDGNNLVLRTNIYGYNMQNKNSFGEWILHSLTNDKTLEMFDDIKFSPILVNELANIIDLAIQKDIEGLYHACGTGSISKYDFGCQLKEIFALSTGSIIRSKSIDYIFKAKRSPNMAMSNEKIKKTLGISIRTPIESISYFKELYDKGYPEKLKDFRGVKIDGN